MSPPYIGNWSIPLNRLGTRARTCHRRAGLWTGGGKSHLRALMLGAGRVIAIDRFQTRLALARTIRAISVDYSEDGVSVLTALKGLSGGIGSEACIDAVRLEADSAEPLGI